MSSDPVIIVGAGLSGLAAAHELNRLGRKVLVLEAGTEVGGRVRTRLVDGFRIDRGFQVFLDSYPLANQLLDLESLGLESFASGARVRVDGKWHTLTDPNRPSSIGGLFESLLAPVGSLADKLKMTRLRDELLCESPAAIWAGREQSTLEFLRGRGFSPPFIDRFFRPFYGGVFLERELSTTARMFQFAFSMFARGHATLPREGMGAIPAQLAAKLPEGTIRLGQKVESLSANHVMFGDEKLDAAAVIVACEPAAAQRLLPDLPEVETKAATTLCFSARGQAKTRLLHLNGTGRGLINQVAFLSAVQPSYAPPGNQLISVTVLGEGDPFELAKPVGNELSNWFSSLEGLKLVHADQIIDALPRHESGTSVPVRSRRGKGLYLAGDYTRHGSIEGALESGLRAAREVESWQASREAPQS